MLLTCLSTPAQKKEIGEKILVVYFSHSGNTRTVAEQITRPTRADLFEIQPQEAYPTDYHSVVFIEILYIVFQRRAMVGIFSFLA